MKAAINNALKLRKRVYQIFEDGRVPLTNNPVEQAIRPSTLIRKNSLFAKSTAGAQTNAINKNGVMNYHFRGYNAL